MILLIDNYDSLTYTLYQDIGIRTQQKIKIVKNDQVSLKNLDQPNLTGLILSPGPGRPENAGNMNQVLKAAIGRVPILGICLGHQAIGEVYGGKIVPAPRLMHGESDLIKQTHPSVIFKNCPSHLKVARYHSLVIDSYHFPKNLQVLARSTSDNTIQAVGDLKNDVFGLEFHPESIMTDSKVADQIFRNFLSLTEQTIKC